MKRLFILLTIIVLKSFAVHAQVTVKGIVTVQNSGKKPLPGVQIIASGSNPQSSDDNGRFALVFKDCTNNYFKVKEIYRYGYVLSDKDIYSRNYVLSNAVPFELSMISRAELARIQAELEEKIRIKVEKKYTERVQALTQKLQEKSIELSEYQTRMKELENQKESTRGLIEDMVESYSRINFDALDSINAQIVRHITEGELLKAEQLIRNKGDIDDRIGKLSEESQLIEKDKKRILREAQKNASLENDFKNKRDLLSQDLYHLFTISSQNYEFDSAAIYLQKRAYLDTTNYYNVWDCAGFLLKQRKPIDAEHFYRILLRIPGIDSSQIALGTNDLAICHANQGKFDLSKAEFKKALDIRLHLEKNKPNEFKASAALALGNYGSILAMGKMFKEGLEYRLQASRKWLELSKESDVFKASLAFGYLDIAGCYMNLNDYKTAEKYALMGLETYREIMQQYPDVFNTVPTLSLTEYETMLTKTASDIVPTKECLMIVRSAAEVAKETFAEGHIALGQIYLKMNERQKSVEAYKASLKIFGELVVKNKKYLVNEAAAYLELAEGYMHKANTDSSLACFIRARAIYQTNDFSAYQMNFFVKERIQYCTLRIAQAYEALRNYDQALNEFESIQDSISALAESDPENYRHHRISILKSLANIHINKGTYEAAATKYKELIRILTPLAEANQAVYEPELALAYYNLAYIQFVQGLTEPAKGNFEAAIKGYKNLADTNFKRFAPSLAITMSNAAWNAYNKHLGDAIELSVNALEIYKKLGANTAASKAEYALCMGRLSRYLILNKDFKKAEEKAEAAVHMIGDDGSPVQKSCLKNYAHALLLCNRFDDARILYEQLAKEATMKKQLLFDFDEFKKFGIDHPDIKKILELVH